MLNYLFIKNLAIVDKLEVNFKSNLNIITGESGAGKSIVIKALGLALGNRGAPELIRKNETQLEIIAGFDIDIFKNKKTIKILEDASIPIGNELIIKRIISTNGKSKSYLNDTPVSLALIKSISSNLVSINSQHQNHSLQKKESQLELLDIYGNHHSQLEKVKLLFSELSAKKKELHELESVSMSNLQLLEYQVNELEEFQPTESEYQDIQEKHKQLAKAEDILTTLNEVSHLLSEQDSSTQSSIHSAIKSLSSIQAVVPDIESDISTLEQCNILIAEVIDNINTKIEDIDTDPQICLELDNRLSAFHSLARKHSTPPESLYEHFLDLKKCLQDHKDNQIKLDTLNDEIESAKKEYLSAAELLSSMREKSKASLIESLVKQLSSLGLKDVQFDIDITQPGIMTLEGIDVVEFMISTNPGQPPQPMSKVASGGELARVNLALTAVTAQHTKIPVLIFDEVDTGVSGKVAALVGECIHKQSKKNQVLCITHHPNVASQPGTHWHIQKSTDKNMTSSKIELISGEKRHKTIASLISSDKLNEEALAHAKRLLTELT